MDRVERYLEVVPLPVIFLLPVAFIIVTLLTPSRLRLPASLVLLVVWLLVGRLPGLGVASAVAKTTGGVMFLIVALAALMHPGPRLPLSRLAWLYPIIGFFSIAFVLTTLDRSVAVILRVQYTAMAVAAICVVRTIVDAQALLLVLRSLAIGAACGVLLLFSDLALHPATAFRAGIGRFEPWGTNSNQIGVVFSSAGPLIFYFAMRATKTTPRTILIGLTGLTAGMALLTASRSTLVTMVFPMIPLFWELRKRPAMVIGGSVIVAIIFGAVLAKSLGESNVGRLTSLETGRVQIFKMYADIVAGRPLVGLLASDGEYYAADPTVGNHPHNAYMEAMYVGGLALLLPALLLAAASTLATFRVWKSRFSLPVDPTLISMLTFMMAIIYAHGFVNGTINYPTYTWAFLHLLLSVFFLSLARARTDAWSAWNPHVVYEEHEEYEDY